jgi:hypothetical protein
MALVAVCCWLRAALVSAVQLIFAVALALLVLVVR